MDAAASNMQLQEQEFETGGDEHKQLAKHVRAKAWGQASKRPKRRSPDMPLIFEENSEKKPKQLRQPYLCFKRATSFLDDAEKREFLGRHAAIKEYRSIMDLKAAYVRSSRDNHPQICSGNLVDQQSAAAHVGTDTGTPTEASTAATEGTGAVAGHAADRKAGHQASDGGEEEERRGVGLPDSADGDRLWALGSEASAEGSANEMEAELSQEDPKEDSWASLGCAAVSDAAGGATVDKEEEIVLASDSAMQRWEDSARGSSGYNDESPKIHSHPRTLKLVPALMQCQQSTACIGSGRQVNLRFSNGVQQLEAKTNRFSSAGGMEKDQVHNAMMDQKEVYKAGRPDGEEDEHKDDEWLLQQEKTSNRLQVEGRVDDYDERRLEAERWLYADNRGQSSEAPLPKYMQCRKVRYCSVVCQEQAWPEHKLSSNLSQVVCVARQGGDSDTWQQKVPPVPSRADTCRGVVSQVEEGQGTRKIRDMGRVKYEIFGGAGEVGVGQGQRARACSIPGKAGRAGGGTGLKEQRQGHTGSAALNGLELHSFSLELHRRDEQGQEMSALMFGGALPRVKSEFKSDAGEAHWVGVSVALSITADLFLL